MANKIRFKVCGASYTVITDESEEYILKLAEKLDKDVSTIVDNSTSTSVVSATVVTALGYLDDIRKAEDSADHMRSQVYEYLNDAAQAKADNVDAERKIAALQKQVEELKAQLNKA